MPATNPRITITLTATTAAQLRRLSELTGNSQSALVSTLLESNEQTFARLITVLAAADEAKSSMTAEFAAGLADAQTRMEKQLGLALEGFDVATAPLLDEAEKVIRRATRKVRGKGAGDAPSRRATAPAAASVPTPISNRGVRSGPKTVKSSGKSRG